MQSLKAQFTFRLDVVDHAKIKKIAAQENRSMTNMIETLVKKEIARYESQNGTITLTDEERDISTKGKCPIFYSNPGSDSTSGSVYCSASCRQVSLASNRVKRSG